MKPRYHEIPEELRSLSNWVIWKLEKRANKSGVVRETKIPYNARSEKHAKSNDPSTWSGFGDAAAALKRGYNGLGFCLTPPYVGVDLDGCRQNEVQEPWAEEIIHELDSYSELSPSSHGVHVIVKGELPDGPRQKDLGGDHHGVGLYDAARGRYLTMTGVRIGGDGTIAERTVELRRIHARLFPAQPKPKVKATAGTYATDDDLIARARKANDGGKFARLWDGQWEGAYTSQS
jgi:putative DNA primase/helicase